MGIATAKERAQASLEGRQAKRNKRSKGKKTAQAGPSLFQAIKLAKRAHREAVEFGQRVNKIIETAFKQADEHVVAVIDMDLSREHEKALFEVVAWCGKNPHSPYSYRAGEGGTIWLAKAKRAG